MSLRPAGKPVYSGSNLQVCRALGISNTTACVSGAERACDRRVRSPVAVAAPPRTVPKVQITTVTRGAFERRSLNSFTAMQVEECGAAIAPPTNVAATSIR